MRYIFLLLGSLLTFGATAQNVELTSKSELKDLMNDNSINFYDVVNAGEAFFNSIDKGAKGSGYKPFMRWINANEYKYYPDGDRSAVDPDRKSVV